MGHFCRSLIAKRWSFVLALNVFDRQRSMIATTKMKNEEAGEPHLILEFSGIIPSGNFNSCLSDCFKCLCVATMMLKHKDSKSLVEGSVSAIEDFHPIYEVEICQRIYGGWPLLTGSGLLQEAQVSFVIGCSSSSIS